jgi:hypothetical protein
MKPALPVHVAVAPVEIRDDEYRSIERTILLASLFNLRVTMCGGFQLAGKFVFSLSLLPKTPFEIQLLLMQVFANSFSLRSRCSSR